MNKYSTQERLRYAFDNTMSKGAIVLIGWIALIAAIVIFIISLIVTWSGIVANVGVTEQFWSYLMLTLEPDAPNSPAWSFRIATLLVVLIGILLISTLIGAITTTIEDRLDKLRQGRSKVLERDHIVILGWSEQIFIIISELLVANEHRSKFCIVILGDKDKVEMEDEIRQKVGNLRNARVICRHGNPIEITDLEIASVYTAKSIIILAPEEDDADSSAIKTLLAIINDPQRHPEPYHIVMHIYESKNARVAKIVGRDEVEVVVTSDFIARVTAQTSRQSGLSTVYMELLDFKGNDIYFHHEPKLEGMTYAEVLLAYEDSAPIGLLLQGGIPYLNPPMDMSIQKGDEIITIAEDSFSIHLSKQKNPMIDEILIQNRQMGSPEPEHTLILGWNRSVPHVITELDRYVAPGSTVTVVANIPGAEEILTTRCKGLENQTFSFLYGDTADRDLLDTLPLENFDHGIIVAYSDQLDVQHADAHTLVTLLHVRDIVYQHALTLSIVSEMLDMRNRNLVTVTQADDFVVSDQLVSFYLSQISVNKALHTIFAELFDADGMEIYLKAATSYVKSGVPLDFYTVITAASQRGETAIGYRLNKDAHDPSRDYGLVINPLKSEQIIFSKDDKMIVIAED